MNENDLLAQLGIQPYYMSTGNNPKFFSQEQIRPVGVLPMDQLQMMQQEMQQPMQGGYDGDMDYDTGEPTMASRLYDLLGGIGNAIDLPGSMVRDVMTIRNPLDQLLSPFSSEDRVSGRDVLRDYGMAGQDDTYGNAIAGMLLEMATNPLSYGTAGLAGMRGAAGMLGGTAQGIGKAGLGAVGKISPEFADDVAMGASNAMRWAKDTGQWAKQGLQDRVGGAMDDVSRFVKRESLPEGGRFVGPQMASPGYYTKAARTMESDAAGLRGMGMNMDSSFNTQPLYDLAAKSLSQPQLNYNPSAYNTAMGYLDAGINRAGRGANRAYTYVTETNPGQAALLAGLGVPAARYATGLDDENYETDPYYGDPRSRMNDLAGSFQRM